MARDVKPKRERAKAGDTAIYLYCISRGAAVASRKIRGVNSGSLVEPLRCDNLVCWTSRVPRAEFTERLSANMENLDWLAAASVRHQHAVAEVARDRDVLPARFGVVFLSEESLRDDIRGRAAILDADFRRVGNCEEWGVKVFAAPPRAPVAARKSKGKLSGKDYLRAKSALLPRRAAKKPDSEIEPFAAALEQISREDAEGGRISGGQNGMLYQASLLIERPKRRRFESILKHFSKQWAGARRIECTGPWPPYSFVSRSSIS
ncbi:MAG TPA: GvpL/GvpF family gas vesicle protein [Candidatus Acidoferrales bacterium]|nr:GvpL/GvpF family gas vesicle protein [Candidatus Acidoferrales bacterium]